MESTGSKATETSDRQGQGEAGGQRSAQLRRRLCYPAGGGFWYYVESYQAVGFDSFLASNTNVLKGMVIHTVAEASANSSSLLDPTPEASSWLTRPWSRARASMIPTLASPSRQCRSAMLG